jgi:hypothetical protein
LSVNGHRVTSANGNGVTDGCADWQPTTEEPTTASLMIRKLKSGEYRLYSRKVDPKTGKRRNLGTFKTRAAAEKHEKDVQFFKRKG